MSSENVFFSLSVYLGQGLLGKTGKLSNQPPKLCPGIRSRYTYDTCCESEPEPAEPLLGACWRGKADPRNPRHFDLIHLLPSRRCLIPFFRPSGKRDFGGRKPRGEALGKKKGCGTRQRRVHASVLLLSALRGAREQALLG